MLLFHRHRFRTGLNALLVLLCFAFAQPAGYAKDRADILRGGRVGWVRLRTPDQYWQRHSESDSRLSTFIRNETSLNMDPTWYSASVEDLDRLCSFPLIFANSLARVSTKQARQNLAEYLKRGGFLVVDACINRTINPDPARFLANNIAVFKELLPDCEVRPLSPEHEIYGCFFAMSLCPPHTYHDARYDPRWAQHGLYGVFVGDRIVSIITLSGLQCGWSGVAATSPRHSKDCMEMMLNIYVYAMTH